MFQPNKKSRIENRKSKDCQYKEHDASQTEANDKFKTGISYTQTNNCEKAEKKHKNIFTIITIDLPVSNTIRFETQNKTEKDYLIQVRFIFYLFVFLCEKTNIANGKQYYHLSLYIQIISDVLIDIASAFYIKMIDIRNTTYIKMLSS